MRPELGATRRPGHRSKTAAIVRELLDLATADKRLSPSDVRVYVALTGFLDVRGFQPVKLDWLVHRTGFKRRSNPSRALTHLVAAGYLARGPRICEPNGPCFTSYMLVDPRPRVPVSPPATTRPA